MGVGGHCHDPAALPTGNTRYPLYRRLDGLQGWSGHVTIRITNKCDFLYYVFISFFLSFPYMFRAFMGPSSGVFQAVVFMLPFGLCSALLIVCVRQRTGLWW